MYTFENLFSSIDDLHWTAQPCCWSLCTHCEEQHPIGYSFEKIWNFLINTQYYKILFKKHTTEQACFSGNSTFYNFNTICWRKFIELPESFRLFEIDKLHNDPVHDIFRSRFFFLFCSCSSCCASWACRCSCCPPGDCCSCCCASWACRFTGLSLSCILLILKSPASSQWCWYCCWDWWWSECWYQTIILITTTVFNSVLVSLRPPCRHWMEKL